MPYYELKYPANGRTALDTYSFYANTFGGALDVARRNAHGDWAELSEDGRPVCYLELVSDDGVWLVGGPNCQSAIQRVEITNPQPY